MSSSRKFILYPSERTVWTLILMVLALLGVVATDDLESLLDKYDWSRAGKADWPVGEDNAERENKKSTAAAAAEALMPQFPQLSGFIATRAIRTSRPAAGDGLDDLTSMLERAQEGRSVGVGPRDTHICRTVCSYCQRVTTKSLSALCWRHCPSGGRAFVACLTFWSIKDEHNIDL